MHIIPMNDDTDKYDGDIDGYEDKEEKVITPIISSLVFASHIRKVIFYLNVYFENTDTLLLVLRNC